MRFPPGPRPGNGFLPNGVKSLVVPIDYLFEQTGQGDHFVRAATTGPCQQGQSGLANAERILRINAYRHSRIRGALTEVRPLRGGGSFSTGQSTLDASSSM
jgi:hypothetical protein